MPKVQAEATVEVASDTYACKTGGNQEKWAGNNSFRTVTQKIINAHKNDFTYANEKKYISDKGGYTSYVKSLGGVFAPYPGKEKKFKIRSACDFQAAAEYTWGLYSIWGVDYDNGFVNNAAYVHWGEYISQESDGFWVGSGRRFLGAGYGKGSIDENLSSNDQDDRRTNCDHMINSFIKKFDLPFHTSTSYGQGQRITSTSDLQVGDVVHLLHGSAQGHAAIVGEVYSDRVIIYDGGRRFIGTKIFKYEIRRGGFGEMIHNSAYDNYDNWVATRHWNIDQTKTLEGINKK